MDWQTLAGLILPGLATGLGSLSVLAMPHPGDRLMATLLGFTGGVMLAAAVFSLLVPALERGSLGEVLAGAAETATAILPLGLAFAAGAMVSTSPSTNSCPRATPAASSASPPSAPSAASPS